MSLDAAITIALGLAIIAGVIFDFSRPHKPLSKKDDDDFSDAGEL